MPSPPERSLPEKFLVAFSFSGAQRDLVRAVAEVVEQRLGWGTVFFDEWFEEVLIGSAADLRLQRIYREKSEVVVICTSAEYGAGPWPVAEWDSIRARHNRLRADPDPDQAQRIFPMRVGDGEVEGVLENVIWADARTKPVNYLGDIIVKRVTTFVPNADRPRVFLAEATGELEDETKPVNRRRLQTFIKDDCGFEVLPDQSLIDLPPEEYREALGRDIGSSLAFVQLLSPYPWRGGKFDQVQFSAARHATRPMLRFRGDIDLEAVRAVQPEHAEFLTSVDFQDNGPIAGQFEDFKQYLAEKLAALAKQAEVDVRKWQEEERAGRTGNAIVADDEKPLVRVAVRAGNESGTWDSIFNYLVERENVMLDELGAGQSFAELQKDDPCHGFLILCDERTQTDEGLSPREALSQCRLIQAHSKGSSAKPPVALVFWPPPEPAWSRLLKSTPPLLHRVLGDCLEVGLQGFLNQVREVRKGGGQ